MLAPEEIKSIAPGLGADQCGIASAERFYDAPKGFHPRDVYSKCKSVVVFLKQMPPEVINSENPVVYTHTARILYNALDKIGLNLCYALEKHIIHAVPVPTDVPYLHWDAENKHGMGIISMRHAAFNAGLGILGRNTLLINRELGNLVYIGAILIDVAVDPDPLVTDFACPTDCSLCLDACPVKALDGVTVDQTLCRESSTLEHPRGWDIYTCSKCRQVCPLRIVKHLK
jgi:epoxyqueuosine reductase QueG